MKKLALIILYVSFLPMASHADGDVLSSLSAKLKYLNQRQSIISQNIANADTPKYKASDLEDVDFRKMGSGVSGLRLRTTGAGHISGASSAMQFKTIQPDDSSDTSLNGNNVVLEDQMIKMAQTDMEYSKTIGLMRQINGLMRTAIGGNN